MSRLVVPVSERDHSRGPADASVTLVEYGDFECPYCGAAYMVVKELERLHSEMQFVFRNFPLAEIHPYAVPSATAAEAAGLQGKFWEMHDLLFQNQEALDPNSLVNYAELLGLDLGRFLADFQSPILRSRIEMDFKGGVRSGVNGTPSFFINGIRYDGPVDLYNLEAALLPRAA